MKVWAIQRSILLLVTLFLFGGIAFAQTTPTPNGVSGPVRQYGVITPGDAVTWKGNNFIQDGGGSGGGGGVYISGLVYSTTSAATANTAAINSALGNGGTVAINCPAPNSIVYVNAILSVPSNTHFSVGPSCTIRASAVYSPIITNSASQSAWTAIYDNSGVVANGPLSIIRESDVTAWSTGHSFVKGNYTVANGNIYWESVASCTTLGSGTGPSGTGTGISDNTCSWNYVTTYTTTGYNYPTTFLSDAAIVAVVHWPSHGLTAGQYLWLTPEGNSYPSAPAYYWTGEGTAHTAGGIADSAYFGIFPVIAVNDSNHVTVVLRRPPASAFSGIPMLIKKSDMNITVDGGAMWDYNYPTNTYGEHNGTGTAGYVGLFAGIANFHLSHFNYENTNGFGINANGLANATLEHITDTNNLADGIKIYGPAFNVKLSDYTGSSYTYPIAGDDCATFTTEESLSTGNAYAAGDILDSSMDNVGCYAGLRVGAWMMNTHLLMDNIEFSHIFTNNAETSAAQTIPGSGAGIITFYNPQNVTGVGGTIGHLHVHDIRTRNASVGANDVVVIGLDAYNTTINELDEDNVYINPENATTPYLNVWAQNGTIVQANIHNNNANMPGSSAMLYAQTGTVNQVNLYANSLNYTSSTFSAVVSDISTGTINSANVHDNYITGTPGSIVSDNSGINSTLLSNYIPNMVGPLVDDAHAGTVVYAAGNYAPSNTQGMVRYEASSLNAKVSSGGGNNLNGSVWFSVGSGTGQTGTAYGWDILCDVTKLARVTGEYCFNSNTSPGSGSLATSELVSDFGTSAGSWKALYSTTTY